MKIETKDPVLKSLFNKTESRYSYEGALVFEKVKHFAASLMEEHRISKSNVLEEMLSYYILQENLLGLSDESIIDNVNKKIADWNYVFGYDFDPSEEAA